MYNEFLEIFIFRDNNTVIVSYGFYIPYRNKP